MHGLIDSKDGVRTVVGEWDSKDFVAVIIINDEDVVVSRAGWGHKFAS